MSDRRKELAKSIRWIATTGEKLTLTIHTTAIGVMEDARQTGDVTLMCDLFNALHTSQRKRSFTVWMNDHTPIRLKLDDAGKAMRKGSGLLKEDAKTYKPWNIPAASEVTYWDYTREAQPSFLKAQSLINLIDGYRQRLTRAIEEDKLEPGFDAKAAKRYIDALDAIPVPNMVVKVKDTTSNTGPKLHKPKPAKVAKKQPGEGAKVNEDANA